ncbi:MAG: DUF465 domain-containing protein [Deltaproteobacteria bacterium]|nr:DUF465 domain-containing protein [Deltaproteobacteria bacterium]
MESEIREKIIGELIASNFEYKRLHKEHGDLEEKITALDKQRHLSPEDERLRKELQKKKLSGKDMMEKMVSKQIAAR